MSVYTVIVQSDQLLYKKCYFPLAACIIPSLPCLGSMMVPSISPSFGWASKSVVLLKLSMNQGSLTSEKGKRCSDS